MSTIDVTKIVMGAVNRASAATWTLGAPDANLTSANLYDGMPSKPCRLISNDPGLTYLQADHGQVRMFGLFSMHNHSFTTSAQWRHRVSNDPLFTQNLVPDAILSSANLASPTVAKLVEDPASDAGDWLLATSGTTNTGLAVSFPTPTRNLLAGGPWCRFRVLLRKTSGATPPTVELRVREGGVVKLVLVTGLQVAGPMVLSYTWDPAILAAISGANVELELVGTASATSTVEYGAVRWHADLVGTVYDTGLLDVQQQVNGFGTLPWGVFQWGAGLPVEEDLADFNNPAVHVTPTDQVGRYTRTDIWDPTNANTFLDIGEFFLGPALRPPKNPTYGVELYPINLGQVVFTPAGIVHVEEQPTRLGLRFEFDGLDRDTALNSMLRDIDIRLGISGLLVVVLFPADPSLYPMTAFCCRNAELGGVVFSAHRAHRKQFTLEQVL